MIEMVVTSSVLILAILLLRRFTNGKVSMRLRYALWLAVALRLVLPVSLGNSAVSVMNLWPQSVQSAAGEVFAVIDGWMLPGIRQTDAVEIEDNIVPDVMSAGELSLGEVSVESKAEEVIEGLSEKDIVGREKEERESASTKITADLPSEAGRMTSKISGERVSGIFRIVWLLGILTVSTYMIISQVRFRRILYRLRRIVSAERIPGKLADRLTARRIKVYQANGLASPCLVGRNIYVDTKLLKDRQKFGHVLAHEYCHAAQLDSFWAFLRSALVAVYWFHPLVWVAAFAARQDSELACDEAVIRLLGEEERFAYGRTLLYLLSGGHGRIDCAGTALTMEGRKRDLKERVHMIAKNVERKRGVAAAVVVMMLLVCGCAFTGSEREKNVRHDDGKESAQEGLTAEAIQKQAGGSQVIGDASDEESERIRKEYENVMGALDTQEQTLGQVQEDASFALALDYQGVMAGKDDSELGLDRKLDYQAYYNYLEGKQDGQGGEQEEPPENGWYLLCRNEEAQVSLYGLYTKEFGPRGIKTLIGEDVNTYDISWCPSPANGDHSNIRALESAQDGLPRRFVFKILAESTSDREIWKLFSGFRYDTGTVEMAELTAQMYRDWVDRYLSFAVSESGEKVLITYDGDMALEPLDISAYQDQKVEAALISPDVAGFQLYSDSLAEGREGQEDFEGVVLHLAVGLKLEGMDGVWFDGLQPLTVEVLCRPEQEPAFVIHRPGIAEQGILRSRSQQQQLEEIRSGKGSDVQEDEAEGYLSRPLVNNEGHNDLGIVFLNPCPEYDRISDGYGERTNPVTGEVIKHNGVDLAAEKGAAVVAAADGRVYETGFDAENGNYVVLWHGQSGQMTYYTHCEEVLVSKKDQVSAGDKIATVGSTGRSTGGHLHFAVSYDGEWQEPFWDKAD